MQQAGITLDVGDERLCVAFDYPISGNSLCVLSLHGAGPSNKARASYITEHLASLGFGGIRFDFSGHPDSTGLLVESSLEKRASEALAVARLLQSPIGGPILIGTSMGGHVALRIASRVGAKTLVLFCPAAYSLEAESIRFDKGFSEIIRQPNSWNNSIAFVDMQQFSGDVLIIVGSDDKIIPPEIIDRYRDCAVNARTCSVMVIRNGPHNLHDFIKCDESLKRAVLFAISGLC